ncbi:MAG: hypothetical protein AMXMBFR46_02410 [Acidimicrobiia bacterium]
MTTPLGCDVVELERTDLVAAQALVARVWGTPPERPLLDDNTLLAFRLAGEQLLGAYAPGRAHDPDALVGVSIGFVGTHPGGLHLHSHVTGVERWAQLAGVGFALKLAQRDWALARGITQVRWTFDPLVARNAYFNLTKLGARGVAYHVNCYGVMPDATNAGDESDRVEAVWDLTVPAGRTRPDPEVPAGRTRPGPEDGGGLDDVARVSTESPDGPRAPFDLDGLVARGAEVILSLDGEVWPEARLVPVLLACVPADIVEVRRTDPAEARRWRLAARAAIGRALDLGYVAVGATRDGWWILEGPGTPGPAGTPEASGDRP